MPVVHLRFPRRGARSSIQVHRAVPRSRAAVRVSDAVEAHPARTSEQRAEPTIPELAREIPSDDIVVFSWLGFVAIVLVLLVLFLPIPNP